MSAATARRGARAPGSHRRRRPQAGPVLLVLFALVAGAWMAYQARAVTFWSDDWGYIVDRRAWSADALLAPHNGHLVLLHVLVYKLMFAVFGLSSIWPYKALGLGLHLLLVGLVYVYAARRVGPTLGAVAAGLLVIFGSAAEVIVWQFHAGNLIALSAGLGALLMLDREDRRGDIVAACLLAAALASSSFALPFVIGAAVEVLAGRERARRWWVPVAPMLPYLLWRVLEQASASRTPFAMWGNFIERGITRSVGALLALPIEWGIPLTLILVVAGARAAVRPGAVPIRLCSTTAMLLGYWLTLAYSRSNLGEAGNERYLYAGSLFVLLIALELLRGVVIPRRVWPLAAAGLALVALTNVGNFKAQVGAIVPANDDVAVTVTALQVAGPTADPEFQPNIMDYGKRAGELTAALSDLGSPYDVPDVIRRRPPQHRKLADLTLIGAERISLQPAALRDARACRAAGGGEAAELALPPAGAVLRAGPAGTEVFLRRYDAAPGASIGRVTPGQPLRLAAPADRDRATPWIVRVQPAAGVKVCPSG